MFFSYTLIPPLTLSHRTNHHHRCNDAIGCHRWSDEDLIGTLRLEGCDYACYPRDNERRFREKFPPAQVPSTPSSVVPLATEAVLLEDALAVDGPDVESSGELGVVPLEAAKAEARSGEWIF